MVLLGACLVWCTAPATRGQDSGAGSASATAPDLAQRVEGLQAQIERLESELATVKKQLSEAPAAAAPSTVPGAASSSAPGQAVAQAPSTSAPAATAPAPSTLASMLGPLSVTGFVDGYYGYNFEHPHTVPCPANNFGVVPSTSPSLITSCSAFRAFDGPSQQLGLNMIELTLDKPPDGNNRIGYHLGFGFGNAMNVVNGTDPGGVGFAQYVKEAYGSYLAPVGKGLQVDFGKFVTQHGAEVIESKDNWNYSRGLLFTYAIPFYHFGLRSKYVFNDKYQFSAYLVNGWNNIIDNNSGKTFGLQFGWNPSKKVGLVQNYMVGPEQANNNSNVRQLWDTVLTYSPTRRLSLMWNYDYGRGDRIATAVHPVFWTGAAGYIKYAFNDKYALATRYEYYDDHNGFTTGTLVGQHLSEVTETLERRVSGSLITRFEFRRDMSNEPSFTKGSSPVKSQNTVAAGLVYTFDMKELH